MRAYGILLAGFLVSVALDAPAAAAACSAFSPAHRVALVELYTSEGCSSCPPADEWLRELGTSGPGPDRLAKLAFHVDYWDYIGWKDPFADPRFSARQKAIAARTGTGFVYTPQVLLNGRDYRHWGRRRFVEDVARINRGDAAADLALSLAEEAGHGLVVEARATLRQSSRPGTARLSLAVYSSGHASRVAAGENQGATLRHDFVVRAWAVPVPTDADGHAELRYRLVAAPRFDGVVAFVQATDGEVLQALHLTRCER